MFGRRVRKNVRQALCLRSLLALVLLVLLVAGRAGAAPVVVGPTFEEAPVGLAMELAYDPTGELTVDDVRAGKIAFEPSHVESPSFGYRDGAEWVRFRIEQERGTPSPDLVLTLPHAITDFATVVAFEDGGRRTAMVAGDHVSRTRWPLASRMPSFPLPRGTREVYARFSGEGSHQVGLVLRRDDAWRAMNDLDTVVQALYFGALGAMLIYNLLVWAAVGLRIYGAYVGFLLAYAFVSSGLSGLLFRIVSPARAFDALDHVPAVAMAAVGAFSLMFVEGLLEFGAKRAQVLKAFRALQGIALVLAPVSLVTRVSFGLRMSLVFIVPWAIVMLSAGLYALHRRERAARWYLLAWGAFIVGVVINVFRTVGLVRSTMFTASAHQFGSAIEFLLLSFALADRIKQLQHEVIAKGELALANANEALMHAEAAKKASDEALAARELAMRELEERRRLQGELDVASQQLTQAENMATLGMLMAGIAHDIRNPIGAVRGAGEYIRDLVPSLLGADDRARVKAGEQLDEALGWVAQGTASMDAISLAMRNQSRGGQTELQAMDLREVVDEALLLCRTRTRVFQVDNQVEAVSALADATGIGQLVMNLVSNAADALKEQQEADWRGQHTILVEGHLEGDEVMLAVHDSGPGIPEALRSKILEPFFTTKPRGVGTGLGLAIVQRVVKQHGGALTIDRSPTLGGARFVARWPRGT
jgi:two-component system, NtrC family, sensor kinase